MLIIGTKVQVIVIEKRTYLFIAYSIVFYCIFYEYTVELLLNSINNKILLFAIGFVIKG